MAPKKKKGPTKVKREIKRSPAAQSKDKDSARHCPKCGGQCKGPNAHGIYQCESCRAALDAGDMVTATQAKAVEKQKASPEKKEKKKAPSVKKDKNASAAKEKRSPVKPKAPMNKSGKGKSSSDKDLDPVSEKKSAQGIFIAIPPEVVNRLEVVAWKSRAIETIDELVLEYVFFGLDAHPEMSEEDAGVVSVSKEGTAPRKESGIDPEILEEDLASRDPEFVQALQEYVSRQDSRAGV